MSIEWSEEIADILSKGKSLEDIGINNWALTKDQSLFALVKLQAKNIPVLGGDVYIQGDRLESAYANWSSNQKNGESDQDFQKRSIEESRRYIESYKADDLGKIYFVLVPRL